jgi:hypothetical protein
MCLSRNVRCPRTPIEKMTTEEFRRFASNDGQAGNSQLPSNPLNTSLEPASNNQTTEQRLAAKQLRE